MYRQSEFKRKFDPVEYKFTKKYIWGDEKTPIYGGKVSDIFSKIFGTTFKKAAKKGAEKAVVSASRKAGEQAGKKAGDKIVKLLSKEKPKGVQPPRNLPVAASNVKKVNIKIPQSTQQEINQRVNSILSGGTMRKII